jgi:hypothetical protein
MPDPLPDPGPGGPGVPGDSRPPIPTPPAPKPYLIPCIVVSYDIIDLMREAEVVASCYNENCK